MLYLLTAPLLLAVSASPLDALPPPQHDATRVYLVRHAQAFSNLRPTPELSEAELDRLTEHGREQARAAAAALRGRGVGLVLSSPAGRARETAALLSEALGAPLRVESRLRPLELGDGVDWDARFAEWEAGRDPAPAGGESMAELGARVGRLVEALAAERPGVGLVLVAHSEVIGAFLGQLQGVEPAKRLESSVGNASISVVDAVAGRLPVVQLRDFRPAALSGAGGHAERHPAAESARLGEAFSLAEGESVQIEATALELGFGSVSSDSRCPKGEQCVWEGDAVVRIWLRRDTDPEQIFELHTSPKYATSAGYQGHLIRLLRLDPVPVTGRALAERDYEASLEVTEGAAETQAETR